jgi:cytochrome c553
MVGQQHIPRLAGQHKAYLLEQLKGFKAMTRSDFDGTMTSAAQGLAADELDMVAEYLSTLVAP